MPIVTLTPNKNAAGDRLAARAARFGSRAPDERSTDVEAVETPTEPIPFKLRSRSRSRLKKKIEQLRRKNEQASMDKNGLKKVVPVDSSAAVQSPPPSTPPPPHDNAPHGQVQAPHAEPPPAQPPSGIPALLGSPAHMTSGNSQSSYAPPPGSHPHPPSAHAPHHHHPPVHAAFPATAPHPVPPQMHYGHAQGYPPAPAAHGYPPAYHPHPYRHPYHVGYPAGHPPHPAYGHYGPVPAEFARRARQRLGIRPPSDMGSSYSCSSGSSQRPRKKRKNRSRMFKAKPTPDPEATLAVQPLKLAGGVRGPIYDVQSFTGWKKVLQDDHRRSFSSHRTKAFTPAVLKEWFDLSVSTLKWTRPKTKSNDENKKGRSIPRMACWLTVPGCICQYEYGGTQWPPLKMPEWFVDMTEKVSRACGLEERPNSCNANYYVSGNDSVGWHTDNEPLFDATRHDCLIISLSLGQSRTFEMFAVDKPADISKLTLDDGDLMTMEGLFQKHYKHRVPREDQKGPRINFTWRWVRQHSEACRRNRQ